jgi:ubiquinol-cytochrome c reductase iron-sulfur subunit
MNSGEMDEERRRFLTAATVVVGGIGMSLAAVPFIGSWLPSEKTKALGAPVEIDISKIEPGQKVTVSWRGKPVFIVHRTEENIRELPSLEASLRDPNSLESYQPDYAVANFRAINEKILVVVGICTHLGCVPLFKPQTGSLDAAWKGGFFCPCHGSKYDLAGRVYKSMPAPLNLPIPPYYYINERILVIGENGEQVHA